MRGPTALLHNLRKLKNNDNAMAQLENIGTMALTIGAVIIGAVVALTLVSNLFPNYSGAVASISENVSTAEWGDETANSISPFFAMLVSLGGLFAILALVFLAYKLRKQ